MKIGDKLKSIREHYGYSQNEFSRVLNIPQTSISNYENVSEITGLLNYIFTVCEHFNIPVWEFFVEDMNELKESLPPYIKPDDAALLKLIHTAFDENAQIELKKSFVQITKTLLIKKADKLKHLPEYQKLFGDE